MKTLITSILVLTILSLSLIQCGDSPVSGPDPSPNIIIIFTDDQGYQDLGCYGSPDILTPHLDGMAREGARFTNFYAAQAVCSASRAALLTGCYPNRIGIHGAFMPKARQALDTAEVTIAELLKEKGYTTALFGKWHLGDHPDFFPMAQGFDEFFGILYSNDMWPYHPQQGPVFDFKDLYLYDQHDIVDTLVDQSLLTRQITERSVDFIRRNKNSPFFLYVPHPQPHVPLFVSDQFKGKSQRGLYGDVIMEIDWSVGQILRALEDEGIDQNTLVLFASDNGPWLSYGDHSGSALPLREGKGTALEGGQRVPMIIRYPGVIPPGRVVDAPLMAIDILPTLAEVCGTTLPDLPIDGMSAWSLCQGQTDKSPHDAYFFYYHQNELHGVRYKNWKLYFPHRYRTLNGRPGGQEGQPVNYEYLNFDQIALYDLDADISETSDVAHLHPAVVDTIKNLANDMRKILGDRLHGIEGSQTRESARIVYE